MEGGLVDEEGGLSPEVEVADDLGVVAVLDARVLLAAAAVAAAAAGQWPGDLEAVAVAVAVVGGERDIRGQIDVNGDSGRGRSLTGERFQRSGADTRAAPTPSS